MTSRVAAPPVDRQKAPFTSRVALEETHADPSVQKGMPFVLLSTSAPPMKIGVALLFQIIALLIA
jgi:hypothetical protein